MMVKNISGSLKILKSADKASFFSLMVESTKDSTKIIIFTE